MSSLYVLEKTFIRIVDYKHECAQICLEWRSVTNKNYREYEKKQESHDKLAHTKIGRIENDISETTNVLD